MERIARNQRFTSILFFGGFVLAVIYKYSTAGGDSFVTDEQLGMFYFILILQALSNLLGILLYYRNKQVSQIYLQTFLGSLIGLVNIFIISIILQLAYMDTVLFILH